MSRAIVPPAPALTPEQRGRFDDEPGLAEEAVAAALSAMGPARFRHLSRDELLSIASIGAMEAATTFDPTRGDTYRTWGFFAALHAVLEGAREEQRRYAKVIALIRASAMVYFAETDVGVEVGVDTEASVKEKLHGFTNPLLGLALAAVAAAKPETGGQDELIEREAAARAGDALREVLQDLTADERRMIELRFVEEKTLAEVAAAMGVHARGYRTFVRRYHELLASLREGLSARGIREMPPWIEEVSGHTLGGDGE